LQISANTMHVFASNNQISNITVEDQAKITHLYVTHNQITDISPITKLSTLKFLHLSGNSIGRLSLDKFAALNELIELGLQIFVLAFILNINNFGHIFQA
jgi:Leucine-rich repeat (LRR) protein